MTPPRKRKFSSGKKITVSIRLPESLKKKLESLADSYGMGFSELLQDGLDQWADECDEKLKRAK